MSSLCQRLSGEGELITFSDTEPIQALQAILEQRPRLIVLERLFAATPRVLDQGDAERPLSRRTLVVEDGRLALHDARALRDHLTSLLE